MRCKCLFSEYEDEYDLDGDCETGCISYPVILTNEHSACSYGQFIVIVDGEPRGTGDMPPGDLQVPYQLLTQIRNQGYSAQPLTPKQSQDFWRDALDISLLGHWHPEARLVQY